MTGPYDQSPERPTLEKTSLDSGLVSSTTEEKPRFQLSREMKILLGVLALGAAVAGWYVVSGAGTPTDTASTPSTTIPSTVPATTGTGTGSTGTGSTVPSTPASGTATTVVPGVTAGSGTASGAATPTTGTSGVTSTAGSSVDVPQVPFLTPQSGQGQGASGQTQGTTDGGDITATAPVGINPADPLAAVPSSNPFQPLTVVNPNSASGTPSASSTAPSPGTTATAGQGAASGQNSGVQVAGAVPLPGVSVAGLNSGGATLSGSGQSSNGSASSGLSSGGAIPLPSVPVGGLSGSTSTATSTGSGNTPAGTTGSATGSSSSVTLPAAGTITPGLQTPALGSLALGGTGTTATGTASTGSGAGTPGTGTALNTTLPSGGLGDSQPGLISQYGSANATAAAVVSTLDQLVQSRNLVFNAVVLGPINTAIFKTDKGFVVVPTGQTLPDSTVVLKEVTSTSATLSLGNDSKILELDKR